MAFALGLLVVIVSIGGGVLFVRSRADAPDARSASALPREATAVSVTRVIDGDTLEVRAAQTTIRVRLYGVDAPELGEPCHDEATRRLGALAGTVVRVVPDTRLTDQFGRELRYVFTDDGVSIDKALVREGLAKAWRADGAQRDSLVALENKTRAARTGCLWAATSPTPSTQPNAPRSPEGGGASNGGIQSS